MRPVAVTATLDEIYDLYNQLDGKIQRDDIGCEMFEINKIDGTDLATLIYVPVRPKKLKQPRLADLHKKLIAINKESFYLADIEDIRKAGEQVEVINRQGQVIYTGKPLSVSRWLTRIEKQRRIQSWIESNKRMSIN